MEVFYWKIVLLKLLPCAIYSMKIYLLRESIVLSPEEEENLKEFCLFVCLVYVKSWIQCQITTSAPKNTLEFYKKLFNYFSPNKNISEQALSKFENHLWYVGVEMIFCRYFQVTSSLVKNKKFSIRWY